MLRASRGRSVRSGVTLRLYCGVVHMLAATVQLAHANVAALVRVSLSQQGAKPNAMLTAEW
jgi:hypothetical protein